MKVRISLTGTTPLMITNMQLADPDNEWSKQLARATAKPGAKRTEEDRKAISRLMWFGSLDDKFVDGVVVMPTANIIRCLVNTGAITRHGTAVRRAVIFSELHAPLSYDGPKKLDELFANPAFVDRRPAGQRGTKTVVTRPKFPKWAIVADAELLEKVLDFDDLVQIVEDAGVVEGIGAGRTLGFGRFQGAVKAL